MSDIHTYIILMVFYGLMLFLGVIGCNIFARYRGESIKSNKFINNLIIPYYGKFFIESEEKNAPRFSFSVFREKT